MYARHSTTAVLVAVSVALAAAPALALETPSPLALPASTQQLPTAPMALADGPSLADFAAPGVAVVQETPIPEVDVDGVHYRPRRSGWGRHPEATSVTQLHLGFYDPDGPPARRFLAGVRGGPMLDSHVQLGVALDWAHQTDNVSSVTRSTTGPGGIAITEKQDLSRAETNFFPIMAFAQISADDDMPVIPYFGGSGGYEVMTLSADDFQTGNSFDATYGGWGWQLWGGAAFPLSGRTRLTAEVYMNQGELSRDVTDDVSGLTYRETVNANGLGVRGGIAWGF